MLERKQNRLKTFDYSKAGYYFVTICVEDRLCRFGEVVNGEMVLNDLGKIVQKCWFDLPNHYQNSKLDEHTVMPNHFHGILIIEPVGEGFKPSPTKTHGLPEIIRGFKTFSSRKINDLKQSHFSWQRSYYDHIIRDDADLNRIREYIRNNPKQWELDEENPKNIQILGGFQTRPYEH
jgi:REP element-mobilizing transposase RayT